MYAKSILKILVIGLLASGCSDVAEKFRNQYNPSRAVVDQGGSNVISTGNACALDDRDAKDCLLYTSPSPRDYAASRMPSSA